METVTDVSRLWSLRLEIRFFKHWIMPRSRKGKGIITIVTKKHSLHCSGFNFLVPCMKLSIVVLFWGVFMEI